jgi:hypothetical protein
VQARRGERQTMVRHVRAKAANPIWANARLLPNQMSRLFFLIFIFSELSLQFASNLLLRTTKIYEFKYANNNYGLSQPREIKCRFSRTQALA